MAQGTQPTGSEDSPSGRGQRKAAGSFVAGILVVAVIGVLIVVFRSGGGESTGTSVATFEPDYTDLVTHREAAGVSTMGEPEDASAHFHPKLALYANGERIQIPVNIGIDPAASGEAMASLHTHESDGTIHVEGMSEATLGQLFEIWGVPFTSEELGSYRAEGDKAVRMWVDGEPSDAFGELELEDGQQIVIAFGSTEAPAPSLEIGAS